MTEENKPVEGYKPHNVLGMANKQVYLTDPMNAPKDTSEDEPKVENNEDTSLENPDKGDNTPNHDWKKRYSDLKTHYDSTKNHTDSTLNDLKTQISELKTQLNSEREEKRIMPKTPEEFNAFRTKYPELADNIITAVMMTADDKSSAVREKLKELEEVTAAIRAKEGLNELKKYHEDAEELKDDPKFIDWYRQQPSAVQALIQSPDPKVIAEGIDLYKLKMGLKKSPKEKKEDAKDAARVVSSPQRVKIEDNGKRIYKESEIFKMSPKEFEKNQDDIRAAQYDGRLLTGQ